MVSTLGLGWEAPAQGDLDLRCESSAAGVSATPEWTFRFANLGTDRE